MATHKKPGILTQWSDIPPGKKITVSTNDEIPADYETLEIRVEAKKSRHDIYTFIYNK